MRNAELIGRFLAATPKQALPADVREAAIRCLVDWTGVTIAGGREPVAQAVMHSLGNRAGVPTGTATQMLESLTDGARPTRAEASDVYRSVVEGAEFVMTSGETAVGDDPVGVITQMSRIVETSELAVRTGTVRGAEPE